MIRRLPACLLLFLLPAAALAVPYDVPFTLHVGETIDVGPDGLVVGFTGVLADSRCPADVVCVWEGDAAAEVVVEPPGGESVAADLHTNSGFIREVVVGDWRVILRAVAPYPAIATGPIDPEAYMATLEVQTLGTLPGVPATWSAAKARYR